MSVNKEGLTALHLASSAGSLSCIQVKLGLTDLLCVNHAFRLVWSTYLKHLVSSTVSLSSMQFPGATGSREWKEGDVELGR